MGTNEDKICRNPVETEDPRIYAPGFVKIGYDTVHYDWTVPDGNRIIARKPVELWMDQCKTGVREPLCRSYPEVRFPKLGTFYQHTSSWVEKVLGHTNIRLGEKLAENKGYPDLPVSVYLERVQWWYYATVGIEAVAMNVDPAELTASERHVMCQIPMMLGCVAEFLQSLEDNGWFAIKKIPDEAVHHSFHFWARVFDEDHHKHGMATLRTRTICPDWWKFTCGDGIRLGEVMPDMFPYEQLESVLHRMVNFAEQSLVEQRKTIMQTAVFSHQISLWLEAIRIKGHGLSYSIRELYRDLPADLHRYDWRRGAPFVLVDRIVSFPDKALQSEAAGLFQSDWTIRSKVKAILTCNNTTWEVMDSHLDIAEDDENKREGNILLQQGRFRATPAELASAVSSGAGYTSGDFSSETFWTASLISGALPADWTLGTVAAHQLLLAEDNTGKFGNLVGTATLPDLEFALYGKEYFWDWWSKDQQQQLKKYAAVRFPYMADALTRKNESWYLTRRSRDWQMLFRLSGKTVGNEAEKWRILYRMRIANSALVHPVTTLSPEQRNRRAAAFLILLHDLICYREVHQIHGTRLQMCNDLMHSWACCGGTVAGAQELETLLFSMHFGCECYIEGLVDTDSDADTIRREMVSQLERFNPVLYLDSVVLL